MKKSLLFIIFFGMLFPAVFAGGILTNTNHSAMFTRMLMREAGYDLDAVYYNPAGVGRFYDGFYISINNQFVTQHRTITTDYASLNDGTYKGTINAPVFPAFYAVYKTGKFALSFGFNPIGGGGGAEFDRGLPSFEIPVSGLPAQLNASLAPLDNLVGLMTGTNPGFANIEGYSTDIFFNGSSIFFGYQLNVSYEINDMISVAVGGRYVSAKDTYEGAIENIMITAPAAYGGAQKAGDYLRLIATQVSSFSAETAESLQTSAAGLDVMTANVEVDVEQSGTAFTPVISLDIQPMENLNFAVKYELQTALEMETTVFDGKSGNGIYVDGSKKNLDMPALLASGLSYSPVEKLNVSLGIRYFFDKDCNWDGREEKLENNSFEAGIGVQYFLNEKVELSAGYMKTETYPYQDYQTDVSHSLKSYTLGCGGSYKVNDKIDIQLGASITNYADRERNYNYAVSGADYLINEAYQRNSFVFALGVNYSLVKAE